MKVAGRHWNSLSPFFRGTLVAFAVALLLGLGVGAILGRLPLPLYFDDVYSGAAGLVWIIAIAAGLIEALRRA